MKEIPCGYRIAGKLQEGEFKRLTCCFIDFDKGISLLLIQCLAAKPFNSLGVENNLIDLVLVPLSKDYSTKE